MATLSSITRAVALFCVLLAFLQNIEAVCRSSDVNIWYAGTEKDSNNHIREFQAAGYRLVYTSNYLTDTDLRVNVIMIRDSSIKTSYRLNGLPGSTPLRPFGFCSSAVSAHTNGKDYITYVDQECDSKHNQEVWYGMSATGFRDKTDELYEDYYNINSLAVYGCKSHIPSIYNLSKLPRDAGQIECFARNPRHAGSTNAPCHGCIHVMK
jgi:hypothetical protein